MTNKLLDACKVMNGLFNESIKTTLTCASHLASMCCYLKSFTFKTSQTILIVIFTLQELHGW